MLVCAKYFLVKVPAIFLEFLLLNFIVFLSCAICENNQISLIIIHCKGNPIG